MLELIIDVLFSLSQSNCKTHSSAVSAESMNSFNFMLANLYPREEENETPVLYS